MALPPSEGLPVPRARDLLIKGKLPEGSVPQAQLFYVSEPRLATFQACTGDTARLICLLSPGKAQGELKLARSLVESRIPNSPRSSCRHHARHPQEPHRCQHCHRVDRAVSARLLPGHSLAHLCPRPGPQVGSSASYVSDCSVSLVEIQVSTWKVGLEQVHGPVLRIHSPGSKVHHENINTAQEQEPVLSLTEGDLCKKD